ncbi:hypothetical protein FRC01_012424, partial [Tulasnella sp. 417]
MTEAWRRLEKDPSLAIEGSGSSPEPDLEDPTDLGWSMSEEVGGEEGGEASRMESWDWTAVEDISL